MENFKKFKDEKSKWKTQIHECLIDSEDGLLRLSNLANELSCELLEATLYYSFVNSANDDLLKELQTMRKSALDTLQFLPADAPLEEHTKVVNEHVTIDKACDMAKVMMWLREKTYITDNIMARIDFLSELLVDATHTLQERTNGTHGPMAELLRRQEAESEAERENDYSAF